MTNTEAIRLTVPTAALVAVHRTIERLRDSGVDVCFVSAARVGLLGRRTALSLTVPSADALLAASVLHDSLV